MDVLGEEEKAEGAVKSKPGNFSTALHDHNIADLCILKVWRHSLKKHNRTV